MGYKAGHLNTKIFRVSTIFQVEKTAKRKVGEKTYTSLKMVNRLY